MKRKTPQQKKAESYAKDRRNRYGNSDKAARTAIPRMHRIRNRAMRRIAREAFVGSVVDEDRVDDAETRARLKRLKSPTKWPDEPLREVVQAKLARRAKFEQRASDHAAED